MTVVALAGAARGVTPAAADTTIMLTTSLDETTANNGCSLREALMYASGSAEAECATVPLSGTTTIIAPAGCYRLTMGQLFSNPLRGPVVLQGAGPGAGLVQRLGDRDRRRSRIQGPGGAVERERERAHPDGRRVGC